MYKQLNASKFRKIISIDGKFFNQNNINKALSCKCFGQNESK